MERLWTRTLGQPHGRVKRTHTGQQVPGWISWTSYVPGAGLKQAANSATVIARATTGTSGVGGGRSSGVETIVPGGSCATRCPSACAGAAVAKRPVAIITAT